MGTALRPLGEYFETTGTTWRPLWAILGLLGDYLRTDWGLFWESTISRAAFKKENSALNFELSMQNGK